MRRRDLLRAAASLIPAALAHSFFGRAVAATAEDLQRRVTGAVFLRGEPSYETMRRRIWMTNVPDRFPDLILRAASVEDVQQAVTFARAQGMRVAIRGGGHNWPAPSLRDGALLIDLSALYELQVDAARQTAVVGPAVPGGDLLNALSRHGLAFPIAHCPSVPMSGYLLNGGWGWNAGIWGPAAASILGMDIVTADGALRHASADENADLFWAARGAGPGFFGLVVRFHLKAHPAPRAITATTFVYPLDAAAEVAAWTDELRDAVPADVEFSYLVSGALPPYADPRQKFCIVSGIAFADEPRAAAEALAFMDKPPAPAMADRLAATDLERLLQSVADLFPPKARYRGNCMWTNSALSDFFPGFAAHLKSAPSFKSFSNCVIYPTAAAGAVPLPDAALSLYERSIVLWYAIWDDADDDEINKSWFSRASDIMQAEAAGFYIGETDLTGHPGNAERSFQPDHWTRLKAIRAKYDPDKLFFEFWGQA